MLPPEAGWVVLPALLELALEPQIEKDYSCFYSKNSAHEIELLELALQLELLRHAQTDYLKLVFVQSFLDTG